jgi:hypothetical protein
MYTVGVVRSRRVLLGKALEPRVCQALFIFSDRIHDHYNPKKSNKNEFDGGVNPTSPASNQSPIPKIPKLDISGITNSTGL